MALHFVGVTPSQLPTAIRLWGRPDFSHPRATWSAMGDIPAEDTVIFGALAFLVPKKWQGKRVLVAHEK